MITRLIKNLNHIFRVYFNTIRRKIINIFKKNKKVKVREKLKD